MSEEQFVLYEHKEDFYILKNPRLHLDYIEMLGDALTSEEIVEELNQLNDKLVELEEENEQLQESYEICKKMLSEAIEENELLECKSGVYNVHRLKKDYEQLKKENEYLKKRIEVISDELYCKDRKLEELGVPIECCDNDE